jgi:hypothetical protein
MDPNKEAIKILETKGSDEAIKYMMTNPATGKPWTYAESRAMFG